MRRPIPPRRLTRHARPPGAGALPVLNGATPAPRIATRRRLEHATCAAAAGQSAPDVPKTTDTRRISCAIS